MEDRASRRVRVARVSALVALTIGALLYLARPTDPAFVGWLDRAGLGPVADLTRLLRQGVHAHVHLPAWFRGAASDGAYAFALGALLVDARPLVIALGAIVAVGHEIAQGLGVAAGTFDLRDLVVLVAAFAFAQVVFRRAKEK